MGDLIGKAAVYLPGGSLITLGECHHTFTDLGVDAKCWTKGGPKNQTTESIDILHTVDGRNHAPVDR